MVKFKKVYGIMGLVCMASIVMVHPNVFGFPLQGNLKRTKNQCLANKQESSKIVQLLKNGWDAVTPSSGKGIALKRIADFTGQMCEKVYAYEQYIDAQYDLIDEFDEALINSMPARAKRFSSAGDKMDRKMEKGLGKLQGYLSNLQSIKNGDQKTVSKLLGTRIALCYKADNKVRGEKIELVKWYLEKATRLRAQNQSLKETFSNDFGEGGSSGEYFGGDNPEEYLLTTSQRLQLYNMIDKNEMQAAKLHQKAIKLYQEVYTMTEIEKQHIAVHQDKRALLDMIEEELKERKVR